MASATPLLDAVLVELEKRKGSWTRVADEVEGIDYSWLTKLAQGRIADPGIKKVELLAKYFRISVGYEGKAA